MPKFLSKTALTKVTFSTWNFIIVFDSDFAYCDQFGGTFRSYFIEYLTFKLEIFSQVQLLSILWD